MRNLALIALSLPTASDNEWVRATVAHRHTVTLTSGNVFQMVLIAKQFARPVFCVALLIFSIVIGILTQKYHGNIQNIFCEAGEQQTNVPQLLAFLATGKRRGGSVGFTHFQPA
jgi:hypothetical protein